MHSVGNPERPLPFLRILFASALLIAPFLAGCAAPRHVRDFGDAVLQHPGEAAFVENVPAFSAVKPHADFAPLAAVMQHWNRSVSPADVEQWYASHSVGLASDERPVRCAWEHGLWAFGQHGAPDTLKARLRAGIPVIVLLQANPLDEGTRRFAVVCGYDDVNGRILYQAGGREPVVDAYADFFSAWRSTFNWMLTVCPPDRITWALDPAELAARAQFHEINGRLEPAIADYEAAAAAGMRRSSLLVRLGNCRRAAGDRGKAEAAYREALSIDDHNGRAYNNLAFLLAEQSNSLDEAVRLARQAMLLEPTNPMAIDTLGFALLQQGKYKEAADVLERARARSRWSAVAVQTEIGLHLAWAHARAGDIHLAREVLADVQRVNPRARIPPDLAKLTGMK